MAFMKFVFLVLLILPFAIFILYIVDKLMDECAVLKIQKRQSRYNPGKRPFGK